MGLSLKPVRRTGHLHVLQTFRKGHSGTLYTPTASALLAGPLHTRTHQGSSFLQIHEPGQTQKRWITLQHLRRTEEAKDEWTQWAKEIKDGKRQSFAQHLESRGLIHDVVGNRDLLHKLFTEKRVGLYAGVDPTGPSLHIGHMLPFMILAWGYVWGLPVTFVLGGATARVGDPTGRTRAREGTHSSVRKANIASMHLQLKKLGESIEKYGASHGYKRQWVWRRAITNNNTWWNKQPVTEWLRDLGAYTRLGPMLGRETVKNRLNSGEGMSFAEFCYPLMQAWDWWVLFRRGVQVQVGGSDQYGNILFGMEAVKEISRNTVLEQVQNDLKDELDLPLGITTPLLTTASGEKIGKSAGNGVWLDKEMTPAFELYQYFVRTPDDAVERYLKLFTFLPLSKIEKIMERQNQDPSQRIAQHALAAEFVELIHGVDEARLTAQQHRQLFGSGNASDELAPITGATNKEPPTTYKSGFKDFANRAAGNKYAPQTNFANIPSIHVTLPKSLIYNRAFNKVLWSAGLVNSRAEGHRLIANNGAHVGGRPEGPQGGEMPDDVKYSPIRAWPPERTQEFIIGGDFMLLRVGRWKHKFVKIVSDEEFKKLGLTAPGWNKESGKVEDGPDLKPQVAD